MPISVIALDVERTLISDAQNREARPGLSEFLLFCCERFERVVLFTSVNRDTAFAALRECGDVPQPFWDKVEYVEWDGKYKDLRFVKDCEPAEVLLVDDDGGWVRSDQQEQWIRIAEYDPYLVRGEDMEFARIRSLLIERSARASGRDYQSCRSHNGRRCGNVG